MARSMSVQPATPGAAKLYEFLVKGWGSVAAGARAANLPDQTVRRYISDPPKSPHLAVITALEKIGAKRDWIVAKTA